jgi:outer membrane protein assembly factor BamB
MKRLGPDLEIIFFLKSRGNSYVPTFAFTNGTWLQLHGTKLENDQVVFSLKSAEPYFRKSFKGTTAELRQLLKDHAAGKGKLPPLDDKEAPGFGPEYAPKKAGAHPQETPRSFWGLALLQGPTLGGGTLFGVIPTLGIGAPLAILALLFPTVFGGVFVLFRQWLAFITLISVNSTLMIVQWAMLELAPGTIRNTWWGSPAALWLFMTLITFLCAAWAWRRQLNALSAGEVEAPKKTELMILAFMSASGFVALGIVAWMSRQISWSDLGWTVTVVMTLGIVAGTLYRAYHMVKGEKLFDAPPLATEGVILCAMLFGHVVFVPAIWGSGLSAEGTVTVNEQGGGTGTKISAVVKKWEFTAGAQVKGMFASSPVIDGDAIYASYSDTTQYATMVRLDRQTGLKKWEFLGKNDDLRQMISTPCVADGKVYFGEGFHDDKRCHAFCVDADTGKEVWRFQTEGQTESSPAIAAGKVYIGAGNDGVYCLGAKDGKKVWRFPPDDYKGRLLRFGGGMLVVSKKLYCGSGVDRNQAKDKGETAVFCLDAETGKLIWKVPSPYPIWSTPVLKDGDLFVSTGNGDVFADAEPPDVPGGTLLCLDAASGKEKWRVKTINGIIESPAIDAHRIYFGCRDGQIHCVARADGKEKWKRFLDTPVIATPVLDSDGKLERTVSVFACSTGGKVCCMNPQDGDIVWTYDLSKQNAYISTSPRLVVTPVKDGYRRQLYFGAGIGGGPRDYAANRPVFYCLEDKVSVD